MASRQKVLDWYVSFMPLLERTGTIRRCAQSRVLTRREAYGPHAEALQRSAYS